MARRTRPDSDLAPGPAWTLDLRPAPGELHIVQAFLSTAPAGERQDELADPQALADWLAAWKLLQAGSQLDEEDLRLVREVRAGLVGLARANSGAVLSAAARARLDRALVSAALRARFTSVAVLRLEPASAGLDGALARLVEIVAAAHYSGQWSRFKICHSPTCRRAFFDFSRNGNGKWCRPRCGNTLNVRAARKRRGRLAARARVEARKRRGVGSDQGTPFARDREVDSRRY